jgi:hypothetical protein
MARDFQTMLSRSLDERRAWESDIKYRLYVRPHGNRGLHVVKNGVDGVEYIVSGPGRTFRPGTVVPTGSNTGTQGEFIVSDPPPGRRGAGRFGQDKWSHQAGGCPRCITGRTYIGLVEDNSIHTLYAYSYADGKLGSLLDQVVVDSDIQKATANRWGWMLADSSTICWSQEIAGSDETIGIWSLGGSASKVDWDSASNFLGNPMLWNGELWFLREKSTFQVDIKTCPPEIDATVDQVGVIDGVDREPSQQIAMVGGSAYAWVGHGSPDQWFGESTTGPPVTSGGGYVGGVVGFGGCVIGESGGPKWVQPDLSEQKLWPAGWESWSWTIPQSTGAQVNVSLTPLEYSVYHPGSGSLVRFGAVQNYSLVDPNTCPLPVIPVEITPHGLPDVMLPL